MTALLLIAVVVLVLLNGFFVASEFALVRVRRSRVEQEVEAGVRGARLVIKQLDDLSHYLSACQLGITLTSLGIGFLGEPAVAQLVEPLFGDLPHGATVALSLAIAYVLTTSLHITIGEQVPKIFAIENSEPVARRIAPPLELFSRAAKPFITVLNASSNGVLRALGVKGGGEFDEGGTPEELKVLIARSASGGHIDPAEAGMLSGVFHLHEQEARQVMTPAPAIVTIDVASTAESALRRCVSTGHTRLIAVEDDNQDRVKGMVHSNQLARLLMDEGADAPIRGLVRETPFVPETKPLDDLLADLQRQRTELAVVIDEYGRTAGIVTIEDIIEEVVGEIDDETDPAAGEVRRLANGDWFVRGHVPIADLADHGLELPAASDAYNSVGGFVFSELGRLPRRGDAIVHNGYSIRVEAVRENRIESVRIRERTPPRTGSEPADPA